MEKGRNKKLALFVPFLGGGGAERVMLDLARGFSGQGIEVDLVLAKAEGPYLGRVPSNVKIVDLNVGRVLFSLPKLVAYLRKERPQAMLSTLVHANVAALIAKRLSCVPVRTVVREAIVLSEDLLAEGLSARSRIVREVKLSFIKYVYSWADGIIAVSQGVADDLVESLRLPDGRVQVAENPIVTPQLFMESEENLEHPWFKRGACPVILGVGRLAEQKDFTTLIKAFALVRQKIEVKLVILGEGPERTNLNRMINELDLDEHVELLGFVDNPFKYMANASVFVLSSLYEGLPGALIQAMAVGTPVIATDCRSGPGEILERGKYGTLVGVGDFEGMAKSIIEILEDEDSLCEIKENGKNRASCYGLEKSLQTYSLALFPFGA